MKDSTIVVLLSSPPRFSAPPSNEDAGRVDDEALPVGRRVKVLLTMKIAAITSSLAKVSNNGFGTDFKGRP